MDLNQTPRITLSEFGEEFVSRAQAKYVVAQFESCPEVEIDFADVDQIGQAFADEMFRVQLLAYPDKRIRIFNASQSVLKMLKHVLRRIDLPQAANRILFDDDFH